MKNGKVLCLMVGLLVLMTAASFAAKLRVAVIEFENKATWHWGDDGAPGEVLVKKLVDDGRFALMEREKLDLVMQEQNLGASGAVTAQTAAKIGKILGVNYIVTGAVSQWGMTGAGGHLGGTNVGVKTYTATVDIRAIDVNTSQIVAAIKGEGKGRGFSGGTRLPGKLGGKHVGGGEGYSEKRAAEALRAAVDAAGVELIAKLSGETPSETPGAGLPKIAKVTGNKVLINKGSNDGIEAGQVYSVYVPGEEIVDPDTGLTMAQDEEFVGKIKITTVKAKMSNGEVIEGQGLEAGAFLRK